MANTQKTVIVTGASQGIGAAVVRAFLERDYNVVATSRSATKSAELKASDKLVLVDGDIGQAVTAQKVVDAAVQKFGSINVVVNNAGICSSKSRGGAAGPSRHRWLKTRSGGCRCPCR